MYGVVPLPRLLQNVNVDVILVIFPVDVRPMGPVGGPGVAAAAEGLPDMAELPSGGVRGDG